MSYTLNYLQSDSVTRHGIEVIVLVNCLVQDTIRLSAATCTSSRGKTPLPSVPASTGC